jgi:hypothetical protein
MATRLTALPSLEPDPLEPRPESVARYVEALQGLSKANAEVARRASWNQIRLAGDRARRRPAESRETLERIFRLGAPPNPALDGPTRGIMIAPALPRALDLALRAASSAWLPWRGKRFDAEAEAGDDLLLGSARWPARALWPSYRPEPVGVGLAAFRFRTYVSPGAVDPEVETLKMDYDSAANPSLLIRDVLSELVQVVRGAYLGKILLRRGSEWRTIGYFGLQPALTVAGGQPVAVAGEAATEAAAAAA